MLNALRKPMKLYQIEYRENSYKEQEKVGENLIEEIPVSIAFNGYTKYQLNDVNLKDCNYLGITNSLLPVAGMKLENYSILFVQPIGKNENLLFLQEIRE